MDQTLATRFTAMAAALGLVGGALILPSAGAVAAAGGAGAAEVLGALETAAPVRIAGPAPTPTDGDAIPFSVADPATAPRPVVTVAIGGVQLLLLLDTGSTGIRVTADKIPARTVTVTGPAAPYGYGSGVRLHGDQADADVTIGGYHTGPLPIELVRSTDCFPDKPGCPAADGARPALFGGVLDGVMGVSPEAANGLVNPLWALRDKDGDHIGRQFAVQFTPELFSGNILLNVPADGYRLVQLPGAGARRAPLDAPPSWNPRAVQTCLAAENLKPTCAPAMFDSGSPNLALAVPGAQAGTWPAGRGLQVGVPEAGWSAVLTSGPGTGVTVTDAASTATETGGTLLGLPAFAKGPIRYDLAAGTIGFPGPPAPQRRAVVPDAPAPAAAPPAPAAAPPAKPAPQPHRVTPSQPKRPFHETAKKATRLPELPETGVPISAALGAVTALTALLAGIGTVWAARRRRSDHEA